MITSLTYSLIYYMLLFLGPPEPTRFRIVRTYNRTVSTIATLQWSIDPEAIVDHYQVTISPRPPSPRSGSTMVQAPPWNVTLGHNITYNISIVAENCAGRSEAVHLNGVKYSKSIILLYPGRCIL